MLIVILHSCIQPVSGEPSEQSCSAPITVTSQDACALTARRGRPHADPHATSAQPPGQDGGGAVLDHSLSPRTAPSRLRLARRRHLPMADVASAVFLFLQAQCVIAAPLGDWEIASGAVHFYRSVHIPQSCRSLNCTSRKRSRSSDAIPKTAFAISYRKNWPEMIDPDQTQRESNPLKKRAGVLPPACHREAAAAPTPPLPPCRLISDRMASAGCETHAEATPAARPARRETRSCEPTVALSEGAAAKRASVPASNV
mmetsp:Transcript_17061/g.43707  ORF Transcript_17061/g.43707 Transcript_17061/m.43707 type:complete len:257 (-) Transcript_17061:1288-2058(-)